MRIAPCVPRALRSEIEIDLIEARFKKVTEQMKVSPS
jgi:hypothetical protein